MEKSWHFDAIMLTKSAEVEFHMNILDSECASRCILSQNNLH